MLALSVRLRNYFCFDRMSWLPSAPHERLTRAKKMLDYYILSFSLHAARGERAERRGANVIAVDIMRHWFASFLKTNYKEYYGQPICVP